MKSSSSPTTAKLGSQSTRRDAGVRRLPDWIPRMLFLSGFLSILAHVGLILIFAISLRGCEQQPVGFSREETREVGIFVTEVGTNPDAVVPGESRDGDPSGEEGDVEFERGTGGSNSMTPTQATPDQPPVATSLPYSDDSNRRIGPGVNLPAGASVGDPRQPVKSAGGQRAASRGISGGVPGAAFMGTRDEGSKVIFVIDASGSMTSNNSMQVAKSALISSLQALDSNQQFLIIFYDDTPSVLHLRDLHQPQLYAATEIHKTLAIQKIASIHPGEGTQHVPALEMALRLKPDVIFFLTDAEEPPIYEGELDRLKKLNTQQTRIHSIEFGIGQEVPEGVAPRNFLRKLARQNGGTYRYHDVTRFK